MNVGKLRRELAELSDDAPVHFITCGPRGECLLLRVSEYDCNDDGGLSIELENPESSFVRPDWVPM